MEVKLCADRMRLNIALLRMHVNDEYHKAICQADHNLLVMHGAPL
jgi:hypothetical protein